MVHTFWGRVSRAIGKELTVSPRSTTVAFGVVAIAFLSLNIWSYDLWAPDEPRYAQVAREMIDSGNWFTPFVNGEPYMEKPPVFFWTIAAASWPFGDVSAVTARVPSVLAAALTTMFTYLLALRLFNDRIAWWSAIILMTTSRFWWQARTAQIDMVLTALLTIALYAFWRHTEIPSRRWRALFFAMIAIALLTKGPVGIVFPLLLWVAYHWRRPDDRKQFPLAPGMIAAVFIALLWFIPARFAVATAGAGAAIGEDVYRQVIGRALLGVSKAQPPWYYLMELPVDLMPWTLIAPWTVFWIWRNRGNDSARLLIAWTMPALVLFSIMVGKRQIYLLPLLPAFAIAIAASIIPLLDDTRSRYRITASAAWSFVLIALACTPAIVANRFPDWSTPSLYVFTAVAAPFAIVTVFDAWRNRSRWLPAMIALPMAMLMAATSFTALPVVNNAKSARAFCAPLQQLSDNEVDFRLYSFMFSREEYIFYSSHFHETVFVDSLPGNDTADPEEVERMLRAIGPGFYAALQEVPIESPSSMSASELQAVQDALDQFRRSLEETNPEGARYYRFVEDAVRSFASDFTSDGPAFMFVQTRDWPWQLVLAPELMNHMVVDEDRIGARHVLLIANESASGLAPQPTND
jgi:4-amino-4-deoxy-L-arabinose transferase-like glycosyltransferase